MKLIFCMHVDKHKSFLQVDFNTLDIKVCYRVILSLLLGMIKHSQYTQSNKFSISLQYLKKKVTNGVYFLHADKHQSFYKLGLLLLMELVRYIQSIKNRKLVIFLQCILKVIHLLLCFIVMENIRLFYGGPVMFIVTCFTAQPDCRNLLLNTAM